jgi:hypothetical protein
MASIASAAVAFLIIAAGASIVFAQDPNNASHGTSHLERSGPISTWPASWTDFCPSTFLGIKLPVFGNKTTVNEMVSSPVTPMPTVGLDAIYAAIVNSSDFQNITAGLGWVTIDWGLQYDSGGGHAYEYVTGQFVILSGNHPDQDIVGGGIQAFYNVETGAVSIQTGLMASCPGIS